TIGLRRSSTFLPGESRHYLKYNHMKSFLRSHAGQLIFLKGALKGHFYSPIPKLSELSSAGVSKLPREIPRVPLHLEDQLKLIQSDEWRQFYSEQPFTRAFLENGAFQYSDALTLYMMIRHNRPRRIIEVGSGYSSQVMRETSKRFFNNGIDLTFIEPYAP